MKLLYATSITLPSYRANRVQITSTARAWSKLLGSDFTLGVGSADIDSLHDVNYQVMGEHVRSFKLAWKYLSYAKKHSFTHLYCREEKLFLFMVLYNKLFFGVPLTYCYELHHLVYIDVWWHRLLLKQVHYVISITNAMKDIVVRRGYPANRIFVAPDAADISLFNERIDKQEARKKLGLSLEKKIIIYTGAINEAWKGVGVLYEASKNFDDSYLFLVLGGKPHYVDIFNSLYPPRSNFSLIGHKPHTEIPLYLRAADVAVLPNSNKSEISRVSTSPMKLFEYMASGIPIVASDLPSIREILDEKKSVLVRPDDPQALAAGIRELAENRNIANALAIEAKRKVSLYTWDTRVAGILNFIEHA